MRTRKRKVATASIVALAAVITLGAAGYATSNAGGSSSNGGTDRAAAATPAGDAVTPKGNARGSTVVTFSEPAIEALGPLNPTGAKPGVFGLTASGEAVQAAFPIVGNGRGSVIDHVGGLTFTDGDATLTLRGYRIDTTTGILSATAIVPGQRGATVDFLTVTPTGSTLDCAVSADLALAKPAADALSLVFDVPDLTGAPIGTACVNPR
jgi:hypothetical protein